MKSDFVVALHVMGFLAARDGHPLSSELLASSYGTHPVMIRRVLSKLQASGLIRSQRGTGGGSILAGDAETISLRQVFEAVNEDQELLPRYRGIGGEVAEVLGAYIDAFSKRAESALMAELGRISVAAMDAEVRPSICALLDKK